MNFQYNEIEDKETTVKRKPGKKIDWFNKDVDTLGAVGSGLSFATDIYSSVNGIDKSNAESDSKTINLALKGASAGMAFGPAGALIGGVAGGIIGSINKKSDQRKRIDNRNGQLTKEFAYYEDLIRETEDKEKQNANKLAFLKEF